MFLLTVLAACNSHENYHINCCTDDSDPRNILFLAESASHVSLQRAHDTAGLKSYLGEEEFEKAFSTGLPGGGDTTPVYNTEHIPWDTIFTGHHFVAELVLVKDNTQGRGYYFQVRTYRNKDHSLVDKKDFAVWSEKEQRHCSGHLSKIDHTFTVRCDRKQEQYGFDEYGTIVPTRWRQ